MEKEARSGEKISGPQPLNNSLASFRHQKGRNSTDPRPANAGLLWLTQLFSIIYGEIIVLFCGLALLEWC